MRNEVKQVLNQIAKMAIKAGADEVAAKHFAISSVISEAVRNGVPVSRAFDAVFGSGSYDAMKESMYDAMRESMMAGV